MLLGQEYCCKCNSATAYLTSTDNAGVRVGRSPTNTEAACFCGYFVLLLMVVTRICYFVLFMVEVMKYFFLFNTVSIQCFSL